MIDISVHELNKFYGSNHVIKGVSFEIYSGERVGLLGKNGSGKTTLFKIISEDEPFDSGSVTKATGKKVEILAQIPAFDENDTVEDILRSSFKEVTEVYDAMKAIEGDGDPAVLQRYGKLMDEYERLGGYEVEFKLEKICNGMKIGEEMRKSLFGLLSGGEKTRVNLARILLRDCDILLLDEPTNHLDLTSLEWLEKFLREYPGTVVVISHDRVFLDNVVTRIIEISEGKADFYTGNYSYYAAERKRRYLDHIVQYDRQQKEIKRIEDRAKWFVDNNRFTTKHHAILSRIDHMVKVEKPTIFSKLTDDFKYENHDHVAKEFVTLDCVCKKYGDKVLLNNVDLRMVRGNVNRIALIGENGCGKTTLIKLLTGEETCDSGIVKIAENVKVAYMPQIIRFDDENATVLETLRNATGMPEKDARSILAGFRFKATDVTKKVRSLSGGERSRLKLCLLMQNKTFLLILDEPTNHLDIESREWMEEALSNFPYAILFVSHDRYFINQFATRIWSMKDGSVTDFYGSYDDYLNATTTTVNRESIPPANNKKKKPPAKAKEPTRIPLETLISEAEEELKKNEVLLEAASKDEPDYQELDRLYQEKLRLEERMEVLYEEWLAESENR